MKIHDVFHSSLIKPYHANSTRFEGRTPPPPPPVITPEGEEEYEVEEILDQKKQKGKMKYLVKWKGYPLYDSTWETVDNLDNAPKLLQAYKQKHKVKKKTE